MRSDAQKKLQPASFRGVPFEVTSSSITGGRRVQVHEFPQRDTPFCEDLGRASRTISFEAFVTGVDYVEKMKALLEALEKPGAGTLVHPWLGQLNVVPTGQGSANFSASLLVASISLDFVEAGEKKYPETQTEPSFLAQQSASFLESSAIGEFLAGFDLSGVQGFVSSAVSGNLAEYLQCDALKTVSETFGKAEELFDLTSEGLSLLSKDPKVLAMKVAGALGLSNVATTVTSFRKVVHQLSKLTKGKELNTSEMTFATSGTSTEQIKKNTEVAQTFVRQLCVANIVRCSVLVGTEKDRVSVSEPVRQIAYDDLIASRDAILEVLDEEMLKTSSDEVFSALMSARTAVWQEMTVRAEEHARLIDFTPTEVMPAVVLAYDFYDDATRDSEIVERNGVRNPGFVPAKTLKMLSR